MKHFFLRNLAVAALLVMGTTAWAQSKVYLTREISPASLVRIYKALGVKAKGRVAVKISTGEGSNPNYLKPELIKDLVYDVDGTIVENNTAYGGDPNDVRNNSANHWKVIDRHGFTKYFPVDIMDEYDEIRIPVRDHTHLNYDIVGGHLANYDFMICLNHFKGHPMGGFGGAIKNLSIGCASSNGKAYIHSAGKMNKLNMDSVWTPKYIASQDAFLESMAAAAQAVVNYFQKENGIIYISVMNNMSIDCDCVDHPAPVKLEDYGILASTDPVALDQACVDIINNQKVTAKNDPTPSSISTRNNPPSKSSWITNCYCWPHCLVRLTFPMPKPIRCVSATWWSLVRATVQTSAICLSTCRLSTAPSLQLPISHQCSLL